MADTYVVTAELAILKLAAGGEAYKYRGSVFPADAVREGFIDHLVEQNLVKKLGGAPDAEPIPEDTSVVTPSTKASKS